MSHGTKNELKNEFVTIKLIKQGIVENLIHEYVELDVYQVEQIKEMNIRLTGGKPYAVLVNADISATVTREARELTASKAFVRNTVAKALLINGVSQRIIANFYIRFNQPAIQTQVFTDREKAIEWLEEELLHAQNKNS